MPKNVTRVEILQILLPSSAKSAPVSGRAALYEWLDKVNELVGDGRELKYNALHWLAVHDDYRSINFLLSTVSALDTDLFLRLFDETFNGESPLDLAGQNGCAKSAIVLIRFFQANFATVKEIFTELEQAQDGKDRHAADLRHFNHDFERKNWHNGAYTMKYVKGPFLNKV